MWVNTISGLRFLEVEQNNQGFYVIKTIKNESNIRI